MEDQVTYPIVSAMLGAPKVKDVRGFSDFGYSYVYIIFEDGTDLYWAARARSSTSRRSLPRLPQGVNTELGPDATGVGWVFQYALVDKGVTTWRNCAPFRIGTCGIHLQSIPGVAEVGAAGRLSCGSTSQRRSQPAGGLRRTDLPK